MKETFSCLWPHWQVNWTLRKKQLILSCHLSPSIKLSLISAFFLILSRNLFSSGAAAMNFFFYNFWVKGWSLVICIWGNNMLAFFVWCNCHHFFLLWVLFVCKLVLWNYYCKCRPKVLHNTRNCTKLDIIIISKNV